MKHILSIILSFSLLVTVACGNDRTGKGTTDSPEASTSTTDENSEDQIGTIEDLRDSEILLIIRSLLGEAVFEDVSIDGIQQGGGGSAKSANVGFDADVGTVDQNMSVSGDTGDVVINADGDLETIQSNGASAPVYYFVPLNLSADFQAYAINDPDVGQLSLSGLLTCEFNGRLEESIETLIGSGRCVTGSMDEPASIALTLDGNSHTIIYDVTFKAHGSPFDLESYVFSGTFTIDGADVDLSDYL